MKIEQLTKEQKLRFPEFVDKWIKIGLSTEPANKKEAEEGINEMYQIAGLKKPKIVWCDSPLSQGITKFVVKKMENDELLKTKNRESVEESVGERVIESVGESVIESVWQRVGQSVWQSVGQSVGQSVKENFLQNVPQKIPHK